jgi:transcriptional regulator with GAF, ATPase, and Fis domain
VGWARIDDELRFVDVNETLARLSGTTRELLIGRPLADFLGEASGEEVAIARSALTGAAPQQQRQWVVGGRLLFVDWLPLTRNGASGLALLAVESPAPFERLDLREELAGPSPIVGNSATIRRLIEIIEVVAKTSATVLLCGESGVGKEVFAHAIHERSPRREGPWVKVNCASVPKELFESEFFGHVRGAFTGAFRDRAGRFELAHGGTLFLDEIGEIPLEQQSKLLRVLQESEFERVGDTRTRKVDVRIVAATNRKLEVEVAQGRFRQDLYYRINVFPLVIPPLRERDDDVLVLAEHFLRTRAGGRRDLTLSDAQRQLLLDYDWPGNVRELEHVIERALILSQRSPLQLGRSLALGPSKAPPPEPQPAPPSSSLLSDREVRELERNNMVAALERAGWRVAGPGGAAELIGMRPSTFRDRMKSFGIQRGSSTR